MSIIYSTPADLNRLASTSTPSMDDEISRLRGAARAGQSWLVSSTDAAFDAAQVAHGRFVLSELVISTRRLLASMGARP